MHTHTHTHTHFIHQKASDYRAWILYYCLPVLRDILPPEYLQHLALLVCSLHFLLSDQITPDMCSRAEMMLNRFYSEYEHLYGKHKNMYTCHCCHIAPVNNFLCNVGLHNCTINVHLLVHLVHYVRMFGPLWTSSRFFFESMNGQLTRLVHGTQHFSLQVY